MKLNCGAERHHYSMFNVDNLVKSQNSQISMNFLNKLWYKAKIVRDKSHTL